MAYPPSRRWSAPRLVELDPAQPGNRQRLSRNRPSDGPRPTAQDAQRALGRGDRLAQFQFTWQGSTRRPLLHPGKKLSGGGGGQTAPPGGSPPSGGDGPFRRASDTESGKTLAGFKQPRRIEDVLHLHLDFQVLRRELRRHQIAFLDPHAVLAGQASARPRRKASGCPPRRPRTAPDPRACWRRTGSGVHVAVARVEDVGDLQPILLDISAIRRSTSGSALTGMVPSRHM
jgi:hypothetical protein